MKYAPRARERTHAVLSPRVEPAEFSTFKWQISLMSPIFIWKDMYICNSLHSTSSVLRMYLPQRPALIPAAFSPTLLTTVPGVEDEIHLVSTASSRSYSLLPPQPLNIEPFPGIVRQSPWSPSIIPWRSWHPNMMLFQPCSCHYYDDFDNHTEQ